MTTKQRRPINDFKKKAYLVYFKVKLDDQDKKWTLVVVVNNLFHEQRKMHKIYQSKQTIK